MPMTDTTSMTTFDLYLDALARLARCQETARRNYLRSGRPADLVAARRADRIASKIWDKYERLGGCE